MAVEFKHDWLEEFYEEDTTHRKIPGSIRRALHRKIFILDAATSEADLRVPPNNRFEHLEGNLKGWCSIRVNRKYRLVFKWNKGVAEDTYLDDHSYR
ncbi:HigB toxin protein [Vibrio astriarenae]|nr:HigB toxin protein [Vibrio sp. C7]